jgi:hypothetical protein
MYRHDLQLRLRDRNDRQLGSTEGNWIEGLLPLMNSGSLTWWAAEEAGGCAGERESVRFPRFYRELPELSPERMYTAEIV